MFVIIVDFLIKENEVENFKPLMLENARASLMDEPGCRQFDVCFDLEDSRKCFLYEVYDSKAAFDEHLLTVHFKTFDEAVGSMLENKQVRALNLIQGTTLPTWTERYRIAKIGISNYWNAEPVKKWI
ncbi:MAG: hypothetical protein CM15mP62_02090 [Rhodospirillaceae bacterium]|nr:MAG: hypothetical protein CM15mP62_02090 [Rhodospirillaceae bacterium]